MLVNKTRPLFLRRRRGISAIVGGIILFAMILSVLGTYFYTIQQTSSQFQQYVNFQNNRAIATTRESFSVIGSITSGNSCKPCIFANVTNSAGVTLLITQIFVINNSNSAILKAYTVPISSQGINAFFTSSINTTMPYTSGSTYIIKVISSNGNAAQTVYPLPVIHGTKAIASSLLASGFGSIEMIFSSFYTYKVITSPTCCSVDLSHQYNGSLASCCASIPVAFSLQVQNLDPNQGVVALSSNTILWGTISCQSGCGSQSSPIWYIGNVNPTTGLISTTYSTVYLRYNQTTTLWFVSNCALSSCTYSSSTTVTVGSSFTYANFILLSGVISVNGNAAPYGQNLPFRTTYFADNIATASNTPGSVTTGTGSQSFTLTVTNSPLTPAGDGISKIVMTVDSGFTGVSAPPMTGWTVSVSGNVITWTASSSVYYIPANSAQSFSLSANVPIVSTATNYIHPITVTFSAGVVTTENIAAGTYVHT